jgi:hypothetical protein
MADAARLYLDNQKNSQCRSIMHHTARPGSFFPIKAFENRVHYFYTRAPLDDALPISFAAPLAPTSRRLISPWPSAKL